MRSSRFGPGQSRKFSRRKLLGGAAATGVVLPFIPILESEAQGAQRQRFVSLFGGSNGTIQDEWTPEGTVDDFEYKRILAPFEEFKSRSVVVAGTQFNRTGPGNKHMKGPAQMFCGSRLNDGTAGGNSNEGPADWAQSVSVDQAFAQSLPKDTPFNSLVVAAESGNNVRHRIAYAGDNQPIVPETDPRKIFDQVFGSVASAPEDLSRIRAEKQSVIDVVKTQLSAMSPKYSKLDQTKVEAHLEAVRAVEKRLAAPAFECGMSTGGSPEEGNDLPTRIQVMTDLIVPILACDVTRTISFMYCGSTSGHEHTWAGVEGNHHNISHNDGDPTHKEELTKICTWYSEQIAYFLRKLDEIPEADGTLLDNTLMLSGNEMGTGGNHSPENIPIVLFGGVGGRIQMGRFLQTNGELTNRLLVSVLQSLGVDVDSFGTTDLGSGPLADL